jgi:hypothetical protein
MPLSSRERMKVRAYLGYPAAVRWQLSSLENAIEITSQDEDACAEVRDVLARIVSVETELAGLDGLALAEKVEESSLRESRERKVRAQGRRECRRLASIISVKILNDVFAVAWSSAPLPMG